MSKQNKQSRLVLGTVQIGLDYGIANETGKPDLKNAKDIIQTAWDSGIEEYDTAQGYGDSEIVLGIVFNKLKIQDKVRVITKPDPAIDHLNSSVMKQYLLKSLYNLGMQTLYCYMLHSEYLLDCWDNSSKFDRLL